MMYSHDPGLAVHVYKARESAFEHKGRTVSWGTCHPLGRDARRDCTRSWS